MRIAHRGDGWCVEHRRIDRPDLQLDPRRVSEFLGKRDVLLAETRLPHIDSNQPVGVLFARQDPGERFKDEALLARFGA